MRTTVASLVIPISLLLMSTGCGGDEGCPAGSMAVGDRCVAVDAGEPGDARVDGRSDMGDDDAGDGSADGGGVVDDGGSDACVATGAETCNGIDDNCDGVIDEDVTTLFFPDADGDGYGTTAGKGTMVAACSAPAGYSAIVGDCNDSAADVHVGATESCNAVDDNCDGTVDEGFGTITHYADADGDTYGGIASMQTTCSLPIGRTLTGGDCDDTTPAVNPDAVEVCNGVDDDCDATIDDGVTTTYYRDADGDTYGNLAMTMAACALPAGYVTNTTDCDDAVATTHPGAAEMCNAADDDCDMALDDGLACVRGASAACTTTCGSTGTGTCTAACALAPAAACTPPAEACNFSDDDCDGAVDESLGSLGGATANASTSKIVLLPTTAGFVAIYTTATGIYARTFGAASGSGTPVLVTSTVPTNFDAATNGDDLIIAWVVRTAYQLRARRYVLDTLVPYGPDALLRTADDFTAFSELAMAMNATQVLIAMSQPSAIGFTRCTNALGSVASGTIRATADDETAKLDLVADPTTSEWLLAFENGGRLTTQFVTPLGVPIGVSASLGAVGGSEVSLARDPVSRVYGALWLESATLRFETLSASGAGASRTPTVRSGPVNIDTTARAVGATAPLLDPVDLTTSGGRWFASYFSGPVAAASRMYLAASPIGDGTIAPAFAYFMSPDVAGTSRRATAVAGTAGNRVMLGCDTTVWRVGCP